MGYSGVPSPGYRHAERSDISRGVLDRHPVVEESLASQVGPQLSGHLGSEEVDVLADFLGGPHADNDAGDGGMCQGERHRRLRQTHAMHAQKSAIRLARSSSAAAAIRYSNLAPAAGRNCANRPELKTAAATTDTPRS